jgi:hypothetical protein
MELKMMCARPGKQDQCLACPRVTFQEKSTAVVNVCDCLKLTHGSVEDLVSRGGGCSSAEYQVWLGSMIKVKVSERDGDHVRVDLSVRRSEVERASKQGVLVLGQSLRAARKVRLGKVVKLTLDKNDQGMARTWVEFKVTEVTCP